MIIYTARSEKILALAMSVLSLITLWASLAHPILDGDIWFHMLYGREMLVQKTLVLDHTQFSWAPSTNDAIYCAWIGQIFYYILYTFFGEFGIIAFRYLACTIPFLAVAHLAWQRGVFYQVVPWLAASTSVFILAIASLDKPELFSLVFMTFLVWNWYQIRLCRDKSFYNVYFFPFIILFWVNTHGIFVFGCIFLLIVGIGETMNQMLYRSLALPKKNYRHLVLALLLSFGTIFCTPYGFQYIYHLLQANMGSAYKEYEVAVTAWRETFSYTHLWFRFFADTAVVLLLLVLFAALRRRWVDFVSVLVNIVFAYFFTKHTRLIYLWVPVFTLTVVYYAAALHLTNSKLRQLCAWFFSFLNIAAIVIVFYLLVYHTPSENWPDIKWSERFVVEEETDFIEANFPNARLGNLYDEGPYLLWRRWPQQQVMIDARYFPYKYWFAEYLHFLNGNDIPRFLEKYRFDLAIIPHDKTELNRWFARSGDWVPVFYGKRAMLYMKMVENQPVYPLQRSASLATIKNYVIAVHALNTSLLLRDWEGYSLILEGMRKNFTQAKQRSMIEGIGKLKPAMLALEDKDYHRAIELFEEANSLKAGYPPGMSAAALSQSLLDWQQGQYTDAVRRGMRALFAQESIPAIYNLAIMGWQLERMQQEDVGLTLNLRDNEREILDKWREALQQLTDRRDVPKRYQPALDNARAVLAGDDRAKVFFLPQDWM